MSADRRATIGVIVIVAVTVTAIVIPVVTGLDVHNDRFPPLRAYFAPAFGPSSLTATHPGLTGQLVRVVALLVAVATAVATVRCGPAVATRCAWSRLLVLCFGVGLVWLVSLASVRGRNGLVGPLGDKEEYLTTAGHVRSVTDFLHQFISRINSPHGSWPVHVAGHPPGLTLFFTAIDRVGLSGEVAAASVVMFMGATTPLAALVTLRRLGAERAARRVALLLVLTPAAVWTAVSADAVVAAALAWGVALLAVAATTRGATLVAAGVGAGAVLVGSLYLSYGMVVAVFLPLAVLVAARSARAVPWTVLGGIAVATAVTAGGFAWWEAYPAVRDRYYAGVAARRPSGYWIWADFAAFAFSAGPVAGGAVAVLTRRSAVHQRPAVLLSAAAALSLVAADLSLMSKAEVERIWLPFVPWLLLSTSLLSHRWRRRALVGQAVVAVLIECLLYTYW